MRSRSLSRLLAIAAGLTLVASLSAASPASADPVSLDQPLPGYTINNPPLAPALVAGVPSTVYQGVHRHAAYDIEVPPRWNGELVMWAHGYRGQGFVLTVDTPAYGLRQKLLDQGYAWAASSYYDNGYDVRAGVTSTHDLADLFRTIVDRPHRTYVVGVSMGGHVIGRSMEQYPGYYAGAMPMCGVLGDHDLFDFFLDYNVVAQDIAGVPAWPVPADYLTNAVPRIEVATGLAGLRPGGPDTTNDLGKQLRAITIDRSGGPRPGAEAAFSVWKDFLFGIAAGAAGKSLSENPGQVATNILTTYEPNSPVDVNQTVQRVPAQNWEARFDPGLTQVPIIFGTPTAPVLTLHGLGDMFVPFSMEEDYAADVARNDRTGLVVQRAIRTAQHCEFSPSEVGNGWDALTHWVRDGVHPAGDDLAHPAAIAASTFGCQFSDPAAYTAGTGTRRLFAACS
jgi:fermentation-respiration switch protein FrsA (DUF1100 family)